MNIEITEKYKASLIPFPKETLEPLKLPTEIFEFLTETGLPIHAGYEITPNAPITFLSMPTIKKYPYLQHQYLQIGSLDVMGELAINLTFQSVYQIQIVNDNGYDMAMLYLMNYSLSQFVDCLGLWLSFYPQFRDEIARNLVLDPKFSLFEHEEMYNPILNKLKEVDPKSMRQKKFFWRRMCEPDII